MWEAPGGKADDLESDETAAHRELFEEARMNEPIVADLGEIRVWQDSPGGDKPRLVEIHFFVALLDREIEPIFPSRAPEHNEGRWFSLQDVLQEVGQILPFNLSAIHAAFALHRVHYAS